MVARYSVDDVGLIIGGVKLKGYDPESPIENTEEADKKGIALIIFEDGTTAKSEKISKYDFYNVRHYLKQSSVVKNVEWVEEDE